MPRTATRAAAEDEPEVVKWYTRARRFPQLIGKTPSGENIWGGPYTYTQVAVGVGLLACATLCNISRVKISRVTVPEPP